MRVLVAGSSGLIGTALVPLLRQADHEVLRLVRREPSAPDERGWNPDAGVVDDGTFDGVDAVINLCGVGIADKRWTDDYKALVRTSRIRPTEVLARAVVEHGVGALLNGSAIGYYGDAGDQVIDETANPGAGFLAEVCRDWEAATEPAAAAGVRVVLLRTGLVLSPSGGLLGPLRPLFSLGLGGKLGDGTQYMPWISLDDEVGAIVHAVQTDTVRGPVNLTGPDPVTNSRFTEAFGSALGRPTVLTVPAFALRLVRGAEQTDQMLMVSTRAVPNALRSSGYPFQHSTVQAALAAAVGG